MKTLYPWIDLLWLPAGMVFTEKRVWFFTFGFILSCVLLLRLQVELLEKTGLAQGFFGWMDSSIFTRGLITYGVFIFLFLLMACFSKGVDKSIYMAASISILIVAFCISTVIMVL